MVGQPISSEQLEQMSRQIQQQQESLRRQREGIEKLEPRITQTRAELAKATPASQVQVQRAEAARKQQKATAIEEAKKAEQQYAQQVAPVKESIREAQEWEYAEQYFKDRVPYTMVGGGVGDKLQKLYQSKAEDIAAFRRDVEKFEKSGVAVDWEWKKVGNEYRPDIGTLTTPEGQIIQAKDWSSYVKNVQGGAIESAASIKFSPYYDKSGNLAGFERVVPKGEELTPGTYKIPVNKWNEFIEQKYPSPLPVTSMGVIEGIRGVLGWEKGTMPSTTYVSETGREVTVPYSMASQVINVPSGISRQTASSARILSYTLAPIYKEVAEGFPTFQALGTIGAEREGFKPIRLTGGLKVTEGETMSYVETLAPEKVSLFGQGLLVTEEARRVIPWVVKKGTESIIQTTSLFWKLLPEQQKAPLKYLYETATLYRPELGILKTPEAIKMFPEAAASVAGIGQYAIPYVGPVLFLGPTAEAALRGQYWKRLEGKTIETIFATTAIGYLGYKYLRKPILRTEPVIPEKGRYKVSYLDEEGKQITGELPFMKIWESKRILNIKGEPISFWKGTAAQEITGAGRRTVVTTPWGEFWGYNVDMLGRRLPTKDMLYAGVPYGKVGAETYKTAFKRLVEYGYTESKAAQVLRYYQPTYTTAMTRFIGVTKDSKMLFQGEQTVIPRKIPVGEFTTRLGPTKITEYKATGWKFGKEGEQYLWYSEKLAVYKIGTKTASFKVTPESWIQVSKIKDIGTAISEPIIIPPKPAFQVGAEPGWQIFKTGTIMKKIPRGKWTSLELGTSAAYLKTAPEELMTYRLTDILGGVPAEFTITRPLVIRGIPQIQPLKTFGMPEIAPALFPTGKIMSTIPSIEIKTIAGLTGALGLVTIPKSVIEVKEISKVVPDMDIIAKEISDIGLISKSVAGLGTVQVPISIPVQVPVLETITKQEPQLKQEPRITPYIPEPFLPTKSIEELKLFGKPKEELPSDIGYKLFVKRKKKYMPVAGLFSKGEAIKKGEAIALGTLAATFKIMPTAARIPITERAPAQLPSPRVFRGYKIVKGMRVPMQNEWIQKRGMRLASRGERREIQMFKKTQKGGRLKWF